MEVVSAEESNPLSLFDRSMEEISREFVLFVFRSKRNFEYLRRKEEKKKGILPSLQHEKKEKKKRKEEVSEERKRLIFEMSGSFREHLIDLKNQLIYLYDDAEQHEEKEESSLRSEQNDCLDYLVEVIGLADSSQTLWHFLEFMVLLPTHAAWLQATDWLVEALSFSHPINVEEAMGLFSSTDTPEYMGKDGRSDFSSSKTGNISYFWEIAYSLVATGRLSDAWSVIQLHSEIADAQKSSDSKHSSNDVFSRLETVFKGHPSVSFSAREADPEELSDASFLRELVRAWQTWTSAVQRLLQTNNPVVTGIPPLHKLLRFLIGEVDSLMPNESEKNWQLIALQNLMYAPHDNSKVRVSRDDVRRVLSDSIRLGKKGASDSGDDAADQLYSDVVISLLNYDIGDFLSFCATPPAWDSSPSANGPMAILQGVCKGMALVNTMHVSLLLLMNGTLSASEDTVQGSFVIKSVVAGCFHLAKLNFPHEVFSSYLQALCPQESRWDALKKLLCPTVAGPRDSRLGTLRYVDSDEKAQCLSNALLTLGEGLLAEAQSVLVTRGLYWLEHHNLPKAFFFFIESQSHGRMINVLDATFKRCVVALCRRLGVSVGSQPAMWSMDGLAMDYKNVSDIHSTTSSFYTRSEESEASSEVDCLETELRTAEDILSVISSHPHFPQLSEEEGQVGYQADACGSMSVFAICKNLRTYCRLVGALIQYEGLFFSLASETTLPAQQDELAQSAIETLQNAAFELKTFLTINELEEESICASSTSYFLPKRYWLHVVDLGAWMNRQLSQIVRNMNSLNEPEEAEDRTLDMKNALFDIEDVEHLHRMLLLSKLTYVANSFNGKGMRMDFGVLERGISTGREAKFRRKEPDEYDAVEMDLHTELLEMKRIAIWNDNSEKLSTPLGFYGSQQPEVTHHVNNSSLYVQSSQLLVDTNVAVGRYLNSPATFESWRKECIS